MVEILIIGIILGIVLISIIAILASDISPPFPHYYGGIDWSCSHWDYNMIKSRNHQLETENYLLREKNSRLRHPMVYYYQTPTCDRYIIKKENTKLTKIILNSDKKELIIEGEYTLKKGRK